MQPPASFIPSGASSGSAPGPSGAPRHRALALGANSIEVIMKKLALSLLGAAAIAVTAVSLLGSHQPAEARSASGGKDCATIKYTCNENCKLAPNMMACYAECVLKTGCQI